MMDDLDFFEAEVLRIHARLEQVERACARGGYIAQIEAQREVNTLRAELRSAVGLFTWSMLGPPGSPPPPAANSVERGLAIKLAQALRDGSLQYPVAPARLM